jgi:hypothetical protein
VVHEVFPALALSFLAFVAVARLTRIPASTALDHLFAPSGTIISAAGPARSPA